MLSNSPKVTELSAEAGFKPREGGSKYPYLQLIFDIASQMTDVSVFKMASQFDSFISTGLILGLTLLAL